MRIIPKKMTHAEKIRTAFCILLLIGIFCLLVSVIAKINTADDPVSRTVKPVSYSTRWDK